MKRYRLLLRGEAIAGEELSGALSGAAGAEAGPQPAGARILLPAVAVAVVEERTLTRRG